MSEDQQPQPMTSTPWPDARPDDDTNYNFTVQPDDQQVRAMALHEAVTLIASGQVAKAYNVKTSDIALEIAGRFEGYLRGEAVSE